VRIAAASVAAGLAISLAAPPGVASAAAVPNNPPPNAAVDQPSRPDVPDAHTMNPSAPDDSAPTNSGPSNSAGSAPSAADPAPRPQRKDKPPDRDPHKFSPSKRTSVGQQSSSGDNDNNDAKESAPAPVPVPATGSGEGAPRLGPSQGQYTALGMDGVWDVAKCGAAITAAIAGVAIPAAKILKIKDLVKAVGGVQKLVQKIVDTFKKVRKGQKFEDAVKEIFKDLGTTVALLAAEVLGIDTVITNCS
jgi:hypothetical protein